jgi:hypothetical protein
VSRFTEATWVQTGETIRGRPVIRMTSPLVFERHFLGSAWVVEAPEGFCCDGPSVPRWLVRIVPVHLMAKAAIIHDVMRKDRRWPKLATDLTFSEACRAEGLPWFWRWPVLVAVMLNFSRH